MKLKWYGQAAFAITADDGLRIVTDPYTPETSGYVAITDPADVVITSSATDSFHCRYDLITGKNGDPVWINALDVAEQGGERVEQGINFHAIETLEALTHRGGNPDRNAMYRFTVDGIRIGHMGDVGNALTPEQIDFFRDLDVLLALAGGFPTLPLDALKTMIDAVRPRLIVPMHFRTLRLKRRNQFWIQTFLNYFPDEQVDFAFNCEVSLAKADLPESMRVLVLTYAG